MGAQISIDVRSRLNSSTLVDLLSDDEFVAVLEQECVELADKPQKNLKKLYNHFNSRNSSAKKGSDSEAVRLQPLWKIKAEDVDIPLEIKDAFEKWKLDHLVFLHRESSSLGASSSPSEHYDYTRNVQASIASDRILRRFLTTVYYDIVSKHSQSDRTSITKDGVEFVAAVICNTGSYDVKTVQEDVASWAKDGAKYRGLANSMGGLGCYFLLPGSLSEWVWIKYLTQDQHERATNLLRKHGIVKKAEELGAQHLAVRIERSLRAPFEASVPLLVQAHNQTVQVTSMAITQSGDSAPSLSQPPNSSQSLALLSVHDSPSPEGSSRPPADERSEEMSSNTNMRRPEQSMSGHNQAELSPFPVDIEIQSMDIDITASCGSRSLPRLSANGLIKIQWPPATNVPFFNDLEHMLFDFYVNSICVGRTVLKNNAYLNEFLPILRSSGRTINPVLALSASYRKELLVEGSFEKEQIEYAERSYSMETAKEVREAIARGDVGAPTAVAAALLLHHATLSLSVNQSCWTKYLYPMLDPAGVNVEANVAMASVAILAMTALPLNGKRSFQHFNYRWIGVGETEQLTKVNSTLGLSRMMLCFIYLITLEAKHPDKPNAARFLQGIAESPQWVDETEDDMPKHVALATAETYRFGTQLYCLARLYGYTPEHPAVKEACDSLLYWLYKLPTQGPLYSSIHPAWCFVIACICVQQEDDYNTLVSYLVHIAGDNKSMIAAPSSGGHGIGSVKSGKVEMYVVKTPDGGREW